MRYLNQHLDRYASNIVESYVNEVENDLVSIKLTSATYNRFFLFKNYKVNNSPSLKRTLFFCCACLLAFTPLVLFFSLIFFLLIIVSFPFLRNQNDSVNCFAMITGGASRYNFSLIEKREQRVRIFSYSKFELIKYLSFFDVVKAGVVCLYTYIIIFFNVKANSSIVARSLRIHSIDILDLCLFQRLVVFCRKTNCRILLDSHYERWNYVASLLAPEQHCIVQHGYARDDIEFKFKFGGIAELYIYDIGFVHYFNKYYAQVSKVSAIKSRLNLIPLKYVDDVSLMLASSPISIEIELRFLDSVSKNKDYCIFVKLHPLHDYKYRFDRYKNITFTTDFLDVDVLVTYNSFLGYEYQSLGKEVVWLKDECSAEEQLREIYSRIDKG